MAIFYAIPENKNGASYREILKQSYDNLKIFVLNAKILKNLQ